jgi:hypothetical protein
MDCKLNLTSDSARIVTIQREEPGLRPFLFTAVFVSGALVSSGLCNIRNFLSEQFVIPEYVAIFISGSEAFVTSVSDPLFTTVPRTKTSF